VLHLDRVAGGVDVRQVGAQVLVDLDPAARAERDPGGLGQRRVGPHPGRQHHEVRLQDGGVSEGDPQAAAVGLLEAAGTDAEVERDATGAQVCLHRAGQFAVQRRHQLIGELDERHVTAPVPQVLGHLQADVAATDHHHVGDLGCAVGAEGIHGRLDRVHVRHAPQHVHLGMVDPG
jgi:hypothetical protein